MIIESPEDFMQVYEDVANSGNFERVKALISDDALYWFSDGSYTGVSKIQLAFEKTWNTIKNENYSISELKWLHKAQDCAVCIYNFNSTGIIDGKFRQTRGRGTNILKKFADGWKIIHEHLSLEK